MQYNRRSFLQSSSWLSLAFVPGVATAASTMQLSTEERQLLKEAQLLFTAEYLAQPLDDKHLQQLLRPSYRLTDQQSDYFTFVNSNYERIQICRRENRVEVVISKFL